MAKGKICLIVWFIVITGWLKSSVISHKNYSYENEDSGIYYDDTETDTDKWQDQWKEQKRWQPDDRSINIHDPYMNVVAGNSKVWTNFDHSRPLRRSDNPLPNPPLADDLGSLNMSNPLSKYHCPINLLYGNNLTVKNFFLLMPKCNMSANDTLETIKTSENQEGSEDNLLTIPPDNTQKEIGSVTLNPVLRSQTKLSTEELEMLSSYNKGNDVIKIENKSSNPNRGKTSSFVTTIGSFFSIDETTASMNGNDTNTDSTTGYDKVTGYSTINGEITGSTPGSIKTTDYRETTSSVTNNIGSSGAANNTGETKSSITSSRDESNLVTGNGEATTVVTRNGESATSVTILEITPNLEVTSSGETIISVTSLEDASNFVTGNSEATSNEETTSSVTSLEYESNLATDIEKTTSLVTGNGETIGSVTSLEDASNLVTGIEKLTSLVTGNGETTSSVTSLEDASNFVIGNSAATSNEETTSSVISLEDASNLVTGIEKTNSLVTGNGETTSSVTSLKDASNLVTGIGKPTSLVTGIGETTGSVTSLEGASNFIIGNGEATSLVTSNGGMTSSVTSLEDVSNLVTGIRETTSLVTGNSVKTSSVSRLGDASILITENGEVTSNEETTTSSGNSLGYASNLVTVERNEASESISEKTSVNDIPTVPMTTATSGKRPNTNNEVLRTIDKYCETFSLSFDDHDNYTINPVSIGQQPAFQNINSMTTLKQNMPGMFGKHKRSGFLKNPRKYFKMLNPYLKK